MRLCLNDSGIGAPYREVTREKIKRVYDIGFRVAGVGNDLAATDDDIKRLKDLFADVGMAMGPIGISRSAIRPDKAEEKQHKKDIAEALRIGGKLGCTSLRYSVGSLHPTNVWMHHPENHTQKALDMLVESTSDLVKVAEDSGCMLCPETTQWTIVGSVERMKEFVDRFDSPYAKIIVDFVNQMRSDTVYESGRYARCAVATLGDRIGVFHVKDVQVQDKLLVSHIDEAPMGKGLLDHAAIIKASTQLEPWKTFSLEHFNYPDMETYDMWVMAYTHITNVAREIGHQWTSPSCTREKWEKEHSRQ